jgi:ABC-2 type transport system permease protein
LIEALWFYGLRSARNRVIKRTRDARYLVGIVLVLAYLYFVLGRSMSRKSTPGSESQGLTVLMLAAFVVMTILLSWWMDQRDHPLALSKPQAQFLITAPLTSRQVMLFKLLTSLPTLLWGAIVMGLVFRSGLSAHPAQRIFAAFVIIVAIQLQRVGAALALTPARSGSGSARRIVVGIVRLWLVAATIVVLAQLASVAAESGVFGLDKTGIPFAAAYQLPWSLLVWPFRTLLAPAYALTLPAFASSMVVALALVAAEAALVFRAEPEWDRIGIARTKEERLGARRSKKLSRSSEGSLWERYITSLVKRPAAALTWKNLIASRRVQPMTAGVVMAVGVPIFLAATLVPAWQYLTSFAVGIASTWAAMLLFAGPNFVRNDLRMDLPQLRLLRSYPLSSLEICAAEIAASVAVLMFLQLVLLILSTAALVFNPVIPLTPGRKLVFALAIAFILPGLNAINVSGQNIFALAFPKWATLGSKRPARSTNPGQYYFSLLISAVVFVLSMIVPVVAAAAVVYALSPFGTSVAIILGALVAGALALGEAALVLRWMAALFDRVDLASVAGESSA